MATVNLGRVGFVPKGEYSASTEYVKFDTVTYGSNTYVAWATVTGVTPGTDDTKWKLLVNNNVDIEELKNITNEITTLLSDGKALLSSSLTDKTSTSGGLSYTLTGNVITVAGTTTGNTTFTVIGSTTSAPPGWMQGGAKYIFNLQNDTPIEVR